jgi:enolase
MNKPAKITKLFARTILDSRGNPTVEVDMTLEDGSFARSSVPSGASVGSKEALELRDGGPKFYGKGVDKAVGNVNTVIASQLLNQSFASQEEFDRFLIELDGTDNKSRLGANAILGVSIAFAKASATSLKQTLYRYLGHQRKLPTPFFNVINGGAHADNALDIQEFMIVPIGIPTFSEQLRAGSEIFHTLKGILKQKGLSTNVGDEGGFAPNLGNAKDALDVISKAISESGYTLGEQVAIALDVAASELFENGKYHLKGEGLVMDAHGLCHYLQELCTHYPIISIEDPMHESDYEGWKLITKLLGKDIQIVGDDVFVTNPKLISYGIKEGFANSVLIKLNQIGTITETIEAINIAHKGGYKAIVSHRSGETEDPTISHLAVSLGCSQIKSGSLSRTDRLCKYNELLRIEEDL